MAPVTLPPPNLNVHPPAGPQDPPIPEDVAEAHLYVQRAEIAYKAQTVPPLILADAVAYKAKIVSAKIGHDQGAAAPAWFQPALTQLKTELQTSINERLAQSQTSINERLAQLQTSIDQLQTSVGQVEDKVDRFGTRLTSVERTSAISYNMLIGDGRVYRFKCVPLTDGSDPVVQHNLPPLNTVADIRRLTDDDLRCYYTGYVGPVGNRVRETQVKGICRVIGATHLG
ncbi:hypothetical protein BDZ97DRAFT_2080835 [Flammula alnicola]|nr:hypothetical protein BDZ97DRAFT_2080835 [Flammula alnicola]